MNFLLCSLIDATRLPYLLSCHFIIDIEYSFLNKKCLNFYLHHQPTTLHIPVIYDFSFNDLVTTFIDFTSTNYLY